MSELQKKLEQLLQEMKSEGSKDYDNALKIYFKEKASEMEENARRQIEITEGVKEILSYSDTNLTHCLENLKEYISLENENKTILRDYKKLQEFVEFLKKGEF